MPHPGFFVSGPQNLNKGVGYVELCNTTGFRIPVILEFRNPRFIGTWTKKYIYSALPPGVLPALLNKIPRNAKGTLKKELHQSLTREQGIEHLNKQIISVVTLINISDNWKQFEKLWNKKFGQQELFTDYEMLEPSKPKELPTSNFNKTL